MRQLLCGDPTQVGASDWARFAFQPGASKEAKLDGFLRVIVRDGLDEFADLDLNVQFLAELPPQALLEGLIRLALAAREFPEPGKMSARRTLRDQEFSASKDESGGHFNDTRRVHLSLDEIT